MCAPGGGESGPPEVRAGGMFPGDGLGTGEIPVGRSVGGWVGGSGIGCCIWAGSGEGDGESSPLQEPKTQHNFNDNLCKILC